MSAATIDANANADVNLPVVVRTPKDNYWTQITWKDYDKSPLDIIGFGSTLEIKDEEVL